MGISILYVRVSSLDGKTDRQRINEKDFDRVIEDKCSGSIPMFDRDGGHQKVVEIKEKNIVYKIKVFNNSPLPLLLI